MNLTYTHLYTGPDGLSHFRDVELAPKDGEPSHRTSSDLIPATGTFIRISDGSFADDWHATPARPGRMFVVLLEGGLEVVASDGTERVFKAGDVFLQDDLTGKGHFTRSLNGAPRKALFVTLDPQ